jgi:hypothetical protein
MIKFSIKRAIMFSFAEYAKHPLLLSVVAASLGVVCWVARTVSFYVADLYGRAELPYLADMVPGQSLLGWTQPNPAALYSFITETPAEELLLRGFVFCMVALLLAFVSLGGARVCLALKDNDEGSFSLLIKNSPAQLFRFLVSYGVVMTGLMGTSFFLGRAALPFFLLCKSWFGGALAAPLFAFACVGSIGILMYCFMASAFLIFVVVDKPYTGVGGILNATHELFYESSGRIFKAFFVMLALVLTLVFIVTGIITLAGSEFAFDKEIIHRVVQGAALLISYPLFLLCSSYIYRWLNPKPSR